MNRSLPHRSRPLSQGELIGDLLESQPGTQEALLTVLDRNLSRTLQLQILRQVFFHSADAICLMGHEGRLVLVNQAFCDLVGRPMNELIGRLIGDVVPLDPERFTSLADQLAQGLPECDYEFILQRPDRPLRVLSLSITPLEDPVEGSLSLTVVAARDVTGRRELERAVTEWQQRARQYLYAIHPPVIAEAMVERRLEAQTLPATVLFTDITNFTSYAARASAAELTDALQRYFTGVTQAVLDHNGWVDKFIGDSVMALFGVPGGSAQHALQAVRAASDMERIVGSLDLPWRHRVGIATGRVVAGDIGSRQKPTYTAIGDAVNLASRLTGIARPGEVLLCPHTYSGVKSAGFRFEDLGELDVRGYGVAPVFRLLLAGQRGVE